MRYINVSSKEIKELKLTLREHTSPQYFMRVQAIVLNNKGYNIPEISEMLEVHYNSVYQWIGNYEEKGIDGLSDKPGRGRHKIITDDDIPKLEALVKENPRRINALMPKIIETLGKPMSHWTVKRALKTQDYTYKRVRTSLKEKQDPVMFQIKKKIRAT